MKIGGLPLYSSFKDSLTKGRSFTAAIDEFSPKGQGIVDNRMLIRLKDQNEYKGSHRIFWMQHYVSAKNASNAT